MNEDIKKTCDLVISNRNAMKKKMMWEVDANTYAVMAGLLTASRGVTADPDKYKECKKILRKNVNAFSEIRGVMEGVVTTKMMLVQDPEKYAQGVLAVYKKLRSIHKLTASPYMVMAAMNIYEHNGVEGADVDIEKLETLYKDLKKEHPMLIWDEDRGYLSIIATSGMNIAEVTQNIEASYEACKKVSISKNGVHSLAQVLALSNLSPERQNEFVMNIIKGLKEKKTPISKDYGMTALGALALLGISEEQLVADVSEASEYLKGQKGFKWYNEGKRLRTVYAALAVFMTYAKNNESLGNVITTNIVVDIAEEIILMIIIAVECAAISSANAASNASSN